jgi:hypothetical protein
MIVDQVVRLSNMPRTELRQEFNVYSGEMQTETNSVRSSMFIRARLLDRAPTLRCTHVFAWFRIQTSDCVHPGNCQARL